MSVMSLRFHQAQHELRALAPVECWRTSCHEPAVADGRGLCAAHLEQARDEWGDDEIEGSA